MRITLMLILLASPVVATEPLQWRTDYNLGRQEATAAGKAVCLVIGGEHCIYCRKLEAVPLADAAVIATLKRDYIAIKVDGAKEADLVKALKVQIYPTTILAGADGSIHAIINGYVDADQMKTHLNKTIFAIADLEKKAKADAVAKAATPVTPPVSDAGLIEVERLTNACRDADEKAAALHLKLAEAFLKRGETDAAMKSWEKVVQLCPNTEKCHQAQLLLTKHKGPLVAVPASMKK